VMTLERSYFADVILDTELKWCEHVERLEGEVCW